MRTYFIRFEFKGQVHEFPADLALGEESSGSKMLDSAQRYLNRVFNVPHNKEPAILLRIKGTTEYKATPEKFVALIPPPRRRKARTPEIVKPKKRIRKR